MSRVAGRRLLLVLPSGTSFLTFLRGVADRWRDMGGAVAVACGPNLAGHEQSEWPAGVERLAIPIDRAGGLSGSVRAAGRLRRLVAGWRPDIVHAHFATAALAAAVAFFPLFSGVLTGLKSADPDLERLFDLYGATPVQRLIRLRLPTALPFMLEGLRVAAGLAVIGAVVAEFVSGSGATQGLAWRLLEAGNRLRTADMLAALTCLMIMGLLLNAAVGLLERAVRRRLS